MALMVTKLNQGGAMAKNYILEYRVYVVRDENGERIADLKKDKSNVFLLGPAGAMIPMEQAEALGLVKVVKAEKAEKAEKTEGKIRERG